MKKATIVISLFFLFFSSVIAQELDSVLISRGKSLRLELQGGYDSLRNEYFDLLEKSVADGILDKGEFHSIKVKEEELTDCEYDAYKKLEPFRTHISNEIDIRDRIIINFIYRVAHSGFFFYDKDEIKTLEIVLSKRYNQQIKVNFSTSLIGWLWVATLILVINSAFLIGFKKPKILFFVIYGIAVLIFLWSAGIIF